MSLPGEAAKWRLDQSLSASSTTFTARVWRLACNGGVTGQVLAPTIDKSDSRIVVTFTVAPQPPGAANCLGNNEVPYEVDLGEPLRGRPLIDGQCLKTPALCDENPTRFPE